MAAEGEKACPTADLLRNSRDEARAKLADAETEIELRTVMTKAAIEDRDEARAELAACVKTAANLVVKVDEARAIARRAVILLHMLKRIVGEHCEDFCDMGMCGELRALSWAKDDAGSAPRAHRMTCPECGYIWDFHRNGEPQ
jgi:RNase P subunit RPR2